MPLPESLPPASLVSVALRRNDVSSLIVVQNETAGRERERERNRSEEEKERKSERE